MRSIRTAIAVAAAGLLAAPAVAGAHVTVQPDQVPAGGFTRLDVRVPNETDNATTTKVELQLPDGFAEASYEPVPGWKVKVTKAKLPQPVKTDDGTVTEEVKRITWSGGALPPGAFQDFGLSVQVPGKAGQTLTFKALQTYSNGQVVRWIGPESSDNPAPTVKLTNASATTVAPAGAPASSGDSGGSDALGIVALVVGALGLATGVVAITRQRRRAGV
jgi:periplasmic copper chaperone A